MTFTEKLEAINPQSTGDQLLQFVAELYPICRSITGDGVRETLGIVGKKIPLTLHEVPSGTQVFDWSVPREWNIRDAWIRNENGDKVIDFRKSNLHVVNYSVPVHRKMSLTELRPHLHTLPDQPEWIPYRTSYYRDDWGFCLAHRQLETLPNGEYEVCIDSRLVEGNLSYGECYLPGKCTDEVLFSCHVCHPSMCNDNLSGISLATWLAMVLSDLSLKYSYRFLFIPGTIGSITWLASNEHNVSRIRHGLVVACVGDPGRFHYKRSRRGDAEIDRAAVHVLKHRSEGFEIREFSPYGYDERQYCSPGFDLPVGSLTRTPHGRFPEYHSSADNLSFVHPGALVGSLQTYLSICRVLEENAWYVNLNPKCEPQLGRRGLYRTLGGLPDQGAVESAIFWVLNLSDGDNSLLDIAERSELDFATIRYAATLLAENDLLRDITPPLPDKQLNSLLGTSVAGKC